MSALAPGNSYRISDEPEWLESSDNVDLSPASVWATDYDEDDEMTLPGRRVEVQHIDLTSRNIENDGLVVDGPRQVRRLDESQVLPGEASFASVILNQPLVENVLKPQHSSEPISTGTVEDYREDRSASRVRLLDESHILDGEASFATVRSRERAKAHSPLTEFFAKTKLSLTQLVLATSALALVLALAVIVLVSLTSSRVVTVSSTPPPTTLVTASQTVSTSIAYPEAVLILNAQGETSGSVIPTPEVAIIDETQSVAEAKLIERPSSDDSRKAPSSDSTSGAVRQEILREVNPVGARVSSPKERVSETKKPMASVARKVVKEQAVIKTPKAPARSEPLETRPKPANTQSERPVAVEKVETKTPPTGGGERPRTVTRKATP